MALDALTFQNDPLYTPLGAHEGIEDNLMAGNSDNEEFFIIVDTTVRVRENLGRQTSWLNTPTDYVRGGSTVDGRS